MLLREDINFYHGKVMLKEAQSGGAWEWHQDYGYWYNEGNLYPNMLSAFVAIDEANRENGCLKVMRGSHRLGRLDHGQIGNQTGIDPEKIKQIEANFEVQYCEMTPVSVLFFHCNTLHASEANESNRHRRSFITAYSTYANPLYRNGKATQKVPMPEGSDRITD